jgi:lipoprotein-anchoring transpeptidase ErfK/SrfK
MGKAREAMLNSRKRAAQITVAAISTMATAFLFTSAASAEPLAFYNQANAYPSAAYEQAMPQDQQVMPQEETTQESGDAQLPANLRRQIVNYATHEASGTVVIDTPHTYLYLVLGNGKAMRYGIGVGREGFTWAGTQHIARKAEWPDWHPPAEMIARQPYLPRFMAGGPGNPLGARAMYLGNTEYRIHGTNAPSTIGHHVSSGCIRLVNEDVEDLYSRVKVGAKVVVMPMRAAPVVAHRTTRMPAQTASRAEGVY